jgi:hypothetical protein
MRVLATIFLLLASIPARAAEWTVGPAPSDDPTLTAAIAHNAEGQVLLLWGREDEHRYQVFAELHLRRGERFGDDMPRYRIDGGEVVETETVRQEGEELGALWGHVGRDVAFWMVWTSFQATILPSDDFAHWFTGREIEIGYTASDGSDRVARFSLDGAAAAVHAATGLEMP